MYCHIVPNTAVLKFGNLIVQNFELLCSLNFVLLFVSSVNGLNESDCDSVGGESASATVPVVVQLTP